MSETAITAMTNRLEGPAPAAAIGRDIVRRALWVAPIVVIVSFGIWGGRGAASSAYGLAVVIVNFVLAAVMLTVAGRISFAAMAGAAMFGYLIRLAFIFAAVTAVKGASWVDNMALGITLIVTHLGLLVWELRHVSSSLAYPGLKPKAGAPSSSGGPNAGI